MNHTIFVGPDQWCPFLFVLNSHPRHPDVFAKVGRAIGTVKAMQKWNRFGHKNELGLLIDLHYSYFGITTIGQFAVIVKFFVRLRTEISSLVNWICRFMLFYLNTTQEWTSDVLYTDHIYHFTRVL